MSEDRTSAGSGDIGLEDLDREAFAAWIIVQIAAAKEKGGDWSNRRYVLQHTLSKLEQAALVVLGEGPDDSPLIV